MEGATLAKAPVRLFPSSEFLQTNDPTFWKQSPLRPSIVADAAEGTLRLSGSVAFTGVRVRRGMIGLAYIGGGVAGPASRIRRAALHPRMLFWLFSVGALLTIISVGWMIPETKGRSLEGITKFGQTRKLS